MGQKAARPPADCEEAPGDGPPVYRERKLVQEPLRLPDGRRSCTPEDAHIVPRFPYFTSRRDRFIAKCRHVSGWDWYIEFYFRYSKSTGNPTAQSFVSGQIITEVP
jgi:hypothetical protein